MPKLPSVYKRTGSPVYWGSIMIKGKRKQYSLTENKAASQRILAQIKADNKERTKYGSLSWHSFKDKFLEWDKANKKPQTLSRDKISIEYLEEFFPVKELEDITPNLLEDFKTWLINRTEKSRPTGRKKQAKLRGVLGPHGVNRTLQSIKAMMHKAEDWDLIGEQKWHTIKKIKTAKGRVQFFSPDEIHLLLQYTQTLGLERPLDKRPPWQTVTLLGARAGLRRAEIQNLMWTDIDFKRGILSITPKKDWNPKDYECRDIPLSSDLKEHLQKLPKRGPYIIYDKYGERLSLNSYTAYYKRILNACKLKGSVHTLRHTFASHLVQNGVDLYTVSKLLGHSSIKTTEIYAHLSPLTFVSAVEKLPKV